VTSKKLSAALRLFAINATVLLSLVVLVETLAFIGRTVVLRMESTGWLIGHPDESEPCLAMMTHPILSHVSAHDGRGTLLGSSYTTRTLRPTKGQL
jgi:hypothetical protein